MVLHHSVGLFYNQVDLYWYAQNSDGIGSLIILFFSSAGKVCVPLLTILSGFGLSKSYQKFKVKYKNVFSDLRFILSHLLQFYSIYWVMLFLNTVVRYNTITKFYTFYGFKYDALKNFILDFFGLSKLFGTGGFGDWFVSAILILYVIFPLLYRLGNKFKYIPIIISFIPWIFCPFINDLGISTDSALFCLLAFTTGIYFAQTNILDKLITISSMKYKIYSVIVAVVMFILRLIFSIYADYFFAISLIGLAIFLISNIKYINKLLILFGKNSANIWLSHSAIIILLSNIVILPILIKYVVVLVIALVLSLLVEFVKRITRYSLLIKKLRKLIEV